MSYYSKLKKEQEKIQNELARFKVKCKHCGHVVVMFKTDKTICKHCGNYIFKNDKAEFIHNLNKTIKRQI